MLTGRILCECVYINKTKSLVYLYVNIDKQRLPFCLGQAIGKRFALFDDVKGRPEEGSELTQGWGFYNIDDLRHHIDGRVDVQLKKKNQQPVSQVSSSGIITCNDYVVPESVKQRVQGPIRTEKSNFWDKHPVQV
ncbi:Large T antigen [Araneus ventricosus]|uniref:Large T antigen n=1 Tax=Araneus ventricosus TaxID=182803 RepID=A0A4Y2R2X4_ARAVE|nr:Large T antigen [Araneus ventricosus]